MSGRGKRACYYTVTAVCLLAAIAVCMLMFYSAYRESGNLLYTLSAFLAFCAIVILTAPCVLVHECGHILFGVFAGMRIRSVRVGWLNFSAAGKKIGLSFSPVAGKTEMMPKRPGNMRGRMTAVCLGGATLNAIFGIVFAILFFVVPQHPVLLFFEFFAPFHLLEAISALLPAELSSGRTDGELCRIIRNGTAEAEVYLRVMDAQGVLYSSDFDKIEKSDLFDTPVVREDDPAFLSLLHLRWQYLMWCNEEKGAAEQLFRLEELSDYLDEAAQAQIKCDAVFMRRILREEVQINEEELQGAKGTLPYMRAKFGKECGDIALIKKTAAQEPATGIKDLELKFIERFIQNF